jgi:REP-associated tyrosine transposase
VRRGRSVVYNLHAHLVFTPKYRHGPFTDEVLRRCEQIMREVCTDFDAELREFNGETDHVHLLVHYPPKVAISRLVNSLKGVSTRRLIPHPQIPMGRPLLVPVLLRAPLAIVKEYIENQNGPTNRVPTLRAHTPQRFWSVDNPLRSAITTKPAAQSSTRFIGQLGLVGRFRLDLRLFEDSRLGFIIGS